MSRRDLRLMPLALTVWGVALLCIFVPSSAWPSAILLLAAAAGLLVVRGVRQRRGRAVVGGGLLVVALLLGGASALAVGFALPARLAASEYSGRPVEVWGVISSSASPGNDGRLWFDVDTSHVGTPDEPLPLSVPVRVGIDPQPGVELGAEVRVRGESMPTDGGEAAVLVVFGSEIEVVRPPPGLFGVAASVRHSFAERALRLPAPGAGLLPGLAVGDTRAVSPELDAAMLASGLNHLTAVSGSNCALIVGAVFWVVALCGGGRALRVVIALCALGAFVVLVTPEPSVIRAAVMAGLAMLSVLLGRPRAGLGMLGLAVILILLSDPWLAATPGFALSAAASAALLLLAAPMARGLARWMPEPLALGLAVPLAAQVACSPIIALFSEQQSLVGLPANLLAAPAAPLATALGLLACLTGPIPPLADLLAASAWLPSAWIAATAMTTAQLPAAQILVPPGVGSALLVGVLVAAVTLVVIRPRRTRLGGVLVVLAVSIVGAALAWGGGRALLDGPLATAATPEGWSIAACDIGQGDALVVRSEGAVAVIDTGPDPAALTTCLRELGIDRVDLLVLTHFDLDHIGGVSVLTSRVGTVLHGPPGDAADRRTLDDLKAGGAELLEADAGQRGQLGGAVWRVLWPRKGSAAFPAGNDASVVIEFAGGDVPRSLFLGDLSATPQRLLLASGIRGTYPVVKVAHHGSADQDPDLYRALRPAAALFSVGADNDYGHPRAETLEVVESLGARALRTDQEGRILLGLREGELVVWTERTSKTTSGRWRRRCQRPQGR